MSTVFAETPNVPISKGAFKRWFATTTTTTTSLEEPDHSVASEAVEMGPLIYTKVPYSGRGAHPLPPTVGKALMLEGVIEQVGYIEDAITDFVPFFNEPFSSGVQRKQISPSAVFEDELLHWDVALEVMPKRPSGKVQVNIRYRGRGTPTPLKDPWD